MTTSTTWRWVYWPQCVFLNRDFHVHSTDKTTCEFLGFHSCVHKASVFLDMMPHHWGTDSQYFKALQWSWNAGNHYPVAWYHIHKNLKTAHNCSLWKKILLSGVCTFPARTGPFMWCSVKLLNVLTDRVRPPHQPILSFKHQEYYAKTTHHTSITRDLVARGHYETSAYYRQNTAHAYCRVWRHSSYTKNCNAIQNPFGCCWWNVMLWKKNYCRKIFHYTCHQPPNCETWDRRWAYSFPLPHPPTHSSHGRL
jgi:hypothetical protein